MCATEHGEQQQRAVGDVGDAVHFLVVARVVAEGVHELRSQPLAARTWMPVTVR